MYSSFNSVQQIHDHLVPSYLTKIILIRTGLHAYVFLEFLLVFHKCKRNVLRAVKTLHCTDKYDFGDVVKNFFTAVVANVWVATIIIQKGSCAERQLNWFNFVHPNSGWVLSALGGAVYSTHLTWHLYNRCSNNLEKKHKLWCSNRGSVVRRVVRHDYRITKYN